ncbi:MAG: hypothetical protein U9Q07_10205, partial [Planctomycetota bacterium]|nr:hypothetical protein [Planctomycetota bacterium]
MAVFKEKNGAWKPSGYPYGWVNPQIPSGRRAFGRDISQYPPFFRVCVRQFLGLINAQNVRAAATSSNGSILKGGVKRE